MVLLLTMEESTTQVISGVPEYVEFDTSEPANVFYTVDGSEPGEDDFIAVGRVYLPTDGKKFTLKAIAISGSITSDILEEEYSTDSTNLSRTRNIGDEGINVLPASSVFVDHLSYNYEGQEAQRSSIDFLDLDIKTNTVNSRGESLASSSLSTETTHSFISIPDRSSGDSIPCVSSVHDAEFFPNAKVILIDGSTQDLLESQAVRIINRPAGTINPTSNFYNDHIVKQPIVSGNFVRAMYNPATNKAVFYYRESRENRWIKSTQRVEPKALNVEKGVRSGVGGFVFKWIENRTISKIY